MKEAVYNKDKDVLAKMAQIQCLKKSGKETLVEHTPLAQSYNYAKVKA